MPVFEWKGVDAKGKKKKGIIDSDSSRSAKERLKKTGVFLTEIKEGKGSAKDSGKSSASADDGGLLSMQIDVEKYFQKVTQAEVSIATRLLANLFTANITVVESLTAIIDQVENKLFKSILSEIRDDVNEGSSLSDAMSKHPKEFPPLYTNMVRAGESSGSLEVVMDRLADYTENQMALRSKLSGSMTYPVIMMIFAFLVIGILVTFVIPKITKIFEQSRVTLPLATRALIGLSDFVIGYWYVLFILSGLAWYFFNRWKKTEKGRFKWDTFKLKSPVFGELIRMIAVSRFATTLSTLLSSGVPLLTAIDIVKNILDNTVLIKVLEEARENIREGESIAQPLKRSGEFPPIVTHMIAIGEQSGQLEEMLSHISKNYDVQVESKLNAMTSLLEPLMIVVMGVVVAFIVLAILYPILQLNQQFN